MSAALEGASFGDFCAAAWKRTAALQQAICDHPFNRALADGTLHKDRFAFYMVQDARYLVGFSRALAAAATRAPDTDAAAFFATSAHQALAVERGLHSGELRRLGWDQDKTASVPTSPTCLAYTSFLGAVALAEPWPVLVAALLPCFWVYHHVGQTIAAATANFTNHPYRAWIATYADDAFAVSVATARRIADQGALRAPGGVANQMLDAFSRASEYEWMFWESAWQLETWPTARWL
jgi:thiaminase (transcriptional activator TenA)